MTTPGIVAIAAAAAVLLLVVVWLYNRLVRARVRVDEAWAQVATDLQRRHDLVPSLVAVVRGYAAHESDLLDEVIRVRAAALGPHPPEERRAAEDALTDALARLLLVAEDYPQLRADAVFADLQTELAATEDRLAFARDFAAHRVARYHELLGTFPSVVIAGLFGFERRPTFVADEHARSVPSASLSEPGARS
ncbi:MAG TPA: LemA family protein [Egicoccus sp.]|nr:LemA family protein [Egicoccus sp.]HSK23234.1 LemA family protein [Egicoccus sp.]